MIVNATHIHTGRTELRSVTMSSSLGRNVRIER
jgi:hypothetical protein